ARPVEGTVLSVVAAAAEGAGRIKSDNLVTVARAAARAASEALDRTPQQLPVLARAGVVDAGGRGLCLLLDALVRAVAEDDTTAPADPHDAAAARLGAPAGEDGDTTDAHGAAVARLGASAGRHGDTTGSAAALAGLHGDAAVQSGASAGQRGDSDAPPGPHGAIDDPAGSRIGANGDRPAGTPARTGPLPATTHGPAGDRGDDGCSGYGFEVQYLLDATPETVGELRRTLDRLGDSLVIVGTGDGDPPTWNVHVHVTDIGPAIEAGIAAGRPYQIRVTQLEDRRPGADVRAAVVVAAGDGLTALFEAEGATVVDRNPSTAELLAAIHATGADCVVLLPNDANTHAVASSAAREAAAAGVQVSVVPTRSPVQALAALAVRDQQRAFADDVIAMAEAAGACRYGEVCTAQRDALTVAGPCRAGDLLGLVDGEVHVIGVDLAEVSHRLLDRMLGGGGELVTLVLGADAPAELETALRGHVHRSWPFIELQCYAGGQPRYHLLAGVE
ncbi:DAK2 domain-containing protein, partial [Actinoplanes sp. NPDC024001]|uniref:DAK2 domain-containing protein n=1 Tax=Actinoplanes sp. NPDC024001 TaxID=3154598 RepID=UPI0033C470BC